MVGLKMLNYKELYKMWKDRKMEINFLFFCLYPISLSTGKSITWSPALPITK